MLPLAIAPPRDLARGARVDRGSFMDGDARLIAAATAAQTVCLWCETEFEPRKGGSPQRFCTAKCRDAFHSAGRRWAEHAVLSGLLAAADLRNGPAEACTLLGGQERRLDYPDIGYEETALSEAQRASARKLQLELSIAPDGILDLCTLGWLDPGKLRDPDAVSDAMAE